MLRSALFLLTYAFLTIFWGSLGVLVGWMLPYRQRFAFIIGAWTAMVLWAFEHLCQVQVEVEGQDDLPATPCLVLARHESTWETLFFSSSLPPSHGDQKRAARYSFLWMGLQPPQAHRH